MIRSVTISSLVLLVILVLYLPSAYPPDRFVTQMRVEHELNYRLWGPDHALRIMDRTLTMYGESQGATPIPSTFRDSAAPSQVDAAVAKQLSEASARLFNNQYLKSIDTLLTLAIYRLSSLLESLPLLLVFVAVALFDGVIRRIVKSKEFLQHSPELFAVHVSLVIVTACMTTLAFVLPVALHPLVLASVPLVVGVFANQAVANFHARG